MLKIDYFKIKHLYIFGRIPNTYYKPHFTLLYYLHECIHNSVSIMNVVDACMLKRKGRERRKINYDSQ